MISCTFENGGKGNLRHATVGTFIVKDDKILLVKRADFLSHGGKYCVPGGYVGRDETLAQAASRETLEETGYEVTIERLFLFTDDPKRDDADKQNIVFFYIGTVGEKIGEPDKESSEVKWFDLNNLPSKEQFAFDHYTQILKYKASLKVS